ncbi:MAG TPA: hypothetical protein VGH89_17750 [Pseudonocardia sp.]|jgi:hypothetical protein
MQAQPTCTKDAVVAGFIVWLARNGSHHHLDPSRRQRCTTIIGQFLDWQRHQRDHRRPCDAEAYRALLRKQGRGPFQIAETERAIALLGYYLRCAPD